MWVRSSGEECWDIQHQDALDMGWDGKGWDGKGWDGKGWGKMGLVSVG